MVTDRHDRRGSVEITHPSHIGNRENTRRGSGPRL